VARVRASGLGSTLCLQIFCSFFAAGWEICCRFFCRRLTFFLRYIPLRRGLRPQLGKVEVIVPTSRISPRCVLIELGKAKMSRVLLDLRVIKISPPLFLLPVVATPLVHVLLVVLMKGRFLAALRDVSRKKSASPACLSPSIFSRNLPTFVFFCHATEHLLSICLVRWPERN
jgi:hypothetical protein